MCSYLRDRGSGRDPNPLPIPADSPTDMDAGFSGTTQRVQRTDRSRSPPRDRGSRPSRYRLSRRLHDASGAEHDVHYRFGLQSSRAELFQPTSHALQTCAPPFECGRSGGSVLALTGGDRSAWATLRRPHLSGCPGDRSLRHGRPDSRLPPCRVDRVASGGADCRARSCGRRHQPSRTREPLDGDCAARGIRVGKRPGTGPERAGGFIASIEWQHIHPRWQEHVNFRPVDDVLGC